MTRFTARVLLCLLALLAWPAGPARADAWSGSTHGLPPSRAFATLVSDSTNNRTILYGGFRSETTPTGMSDLWSYDYFLGEWRQLAPTGNLPPPNWLHAAVYDGFRRRMYALGGQGSALYALDLNTLDWSLLATSGDAPPALTGLAMAYDWRLKQLVVFGGNYGNDLWFLNLGTLAWTHVPSDSSFPPGRSFHSFTVERLKSKVLLYGGLDGGQNYFADLWELDLPTRHWTRLSLPGAPLEGRAYHDAAMDPLSNRLMITGGRGLRASWKDTWAVDLAISTPFQPTVWESLATFGTPPDPDQGTASAPLNGYMFIFGGRSSLTPGDFNRTWTLAPGTRAWTALDTVPADRMDHVTFRDPSQSGFFLFGGVHGAQRLSDSWWFDGNADSWTQLSPPLSPSSRAGACCAVDSAGRRAILFGGASPTTLLKDTWSFNLDSLTWSQLSLSLMPSRRQYASMAADAAGRRLWLFGGLGTGGALADLWSFSLDSNTWTPVSASGGPDPRFLACMTFDPVRRKLMVFGGNDSAHLNNELWSFQVDSLEWQPEPSLTPVPSPREGQSAITDNQDQMVIFGGSTTVAGTPVDEVWAYNPDMQSWYFENNLPTRPAPRWRHTATWNPDNRRMRVFGGVTTSGPMNDTWLLELAAGAVGVRADLRRTAGDLRAPRPNPSRGAISLEFSLPAGTRGELSIFSVDGRHMATLWKGVAPGGIQRSQWAGPGRGGAGVYLARLAAGGRFETRKIVRLD